MKTLLLGDSIFKWFSGTLPGDVENKSSVGCFSWMIERDVEKYNIKDYDKVFLLIGINDFLNRGYTSKKTSECVISVINKILSLNPQELNVLGLLPVLNDDMSESDYCNSNIPQINSILRDYCLENNVNFIDCYGQFLDINGNINISLYKSDGLHPNDKGYEKISRSIISCYQLDNYMN